MNNMKKYLLQHINDKSPQCTHKCTIRNTTDIYYRPLYKIYQGLSAAVAGLSSTPR